MFKTDRNKIEYYKEKKAYWQQFTNDKLTDADIDEIHDNVMAFTKCLIELSRELQEKRKGGLLETTCKGRNESNDENDEMR